MDQNTRGDDFLGELVSLDDDSELIDANELHRALMVNAAEEAMEMQKEAELEDAAMDRRVKRGTKQSPEATRLEIRRK